MAKRQPTKRQGAALKETKGAIVAALESVAEQTAKRPPGAKRSRKPKAPDLVAEQAPEALAVRAEQARAIVAARPVNVAKAIEEAARQWVFYLSNGERFAVLTWSIADLARFFPLASVDAEKGAVYL